MARFGKDMVIYATADLLGSSIGLILSPIYTRLFSVEQYGSQAALAALWGFLGLMQYGGMDSAYPMFRARTVDGSLRRNLVTTASTVAISTAVVVAVIYGSFAIGTDWLMAFAGMSRWEIAAYALTLAPGAIMGWFLYLLRFDRRAAAYARVNLLGRVLAGLLLVPALAFTVQPQRLLVGFMIGAAITTLAATLGWWEVRKAGWRVVAPELFDRAQAKAMLRYGVVLIPASSLYAASTVADRLLVTWFSGPAETAILALALRIAAVAVMLRTWFALVWDPQLIDWIATVSREVLWQRLQLALGLIGGIGVLFVTVAGVWTQPVVTFLYPAGYAGAVRLVPWLVVGAVISALSLVAVATITLAARPKFCLPVYAAGLIINVLIGYATVPHFGARGAVAGVIAGEICILLCWIFIGRIHLKNLPLRWGKSGVLIVFEIGFTAIYSPGWFPGLPFWLERIIVTVVIIALVALPIARTFRQVWRLKSSAT